jgi:hypothetical protein
MARALVEYNSSSAMFWSVRYQRLLSGTLPGILKRRLEAEGERIIEIIGVTILPSIHDLAPSFPFPHLFESFGESKEGKAAQDTARAAVAHIVADLKRGDPFST